MNSIGNTLKEARSKKSVTLEEVHSRIKIHPRVLQLLEDDKFDKLPSPLFVKSFLKSYAEFLEVNPDALIDAYEKEKKEEPKQELFIKLAAERERRGEFDKNFSAALWIAGIAIALMLGAVLLFKAGAWVSQKWTDSRKAAATRPVSQKKKEAKSKPAAPAAKPAAPGETQSAEWLRTVEQGNFPKLNKKAPLELTIKAIDNVWMRVTCDEKVLFQNILKKGTQESWKASKEIQIWTGNSSNMALALNRASLGSPGKGVVKRMIITHDGVRISQ